MCSDDSSVDSKPNLAVILPQKRTVILTFSTRDTAFPGPFQSQNSLLPGSGTADALPKLLS